MATESMLSLQFHQPTTTDPLGKFNVHSHKARFKCLQPHVASEYQMKQSSRTFPPPKTLPLVPRTELPCESSVLTCWVLVIQHGLPVVTVSTRTFALLHTELTTPSLGQVLSCREPQGRHQRISRICTASPVSKVLHRHHPQGETQIPLSSPPEEWQLNVTRGGEFPFVLFSIQRSSSNQRREQRP